jgi:hypothetical protein
MIDVSFIDMYGRESLPMKDTTVLRLARIMRVFAAVALVRGDLEGTA